MTKPLLDEIQALATNPASSVFVSANAGSGKTFVLSWRVIRLLLDGCKPERILCLTYTKSAAAEMAGRIFSILGSFATMPDEDLQKCLAELDGKSPESDRLADARRLMARALETPGNLKIKTLHGFCETVLQRFPLEAKVSGRFHVLDDGEVERLRSEARTRLFSEIARRPDGVLARALEFLQNTAKDARINELIDGFLGKREAFASFIAAHGTLEAALAALPRMLDVPEGATRASLLEEALASPDFSNAFCERLLSALDASPRSSMEKLAADLRACERKADLEAAYRNWRSLFFIKEGTPKKNPLTQDIERALPGAGDAFRREAVRLERIDEALHGLRVAEITAASARLAHAVEGHYTALKMNAAALDYDDLILKTVDLLEQSEASAWVQYKLDEGLDHLLIDEAQDISPLQWRIIAALSDEYFAGYGAHGDKLRTLFAVGDEKQSIFSFQGAAPRLFAQTRILLSARGRESSIPFQALTLKRSFRSALSIVKAVDKIFSDPQARAGLSADAAPPFHETFRHTEPGLVEVWPEFKAEAHVEPEEWHHPAPLLEVKNPAVQLANRIADTVAGWLQDEGLHPPMKPGDILILVRSRTAFVGAINRALKARGIPVAGADRLDVLNHIAALDFIAAAKIALLPEDDLNLASFARSPFAGLSEEDVFTLAHERPSSLWDSVQRAALSGNLVASNLKTQVETLIERARRAGPYAFFAQLAGVDAGRARYRARLGREAEEVIDELLNLALVAEERGVVTLAAFLALVPTLPSEIKREMDNGRDEVRVMTVHGAKGLEARTVFLIDSGTDPAHAHHDPKVLRLGNAAGAPLICLAEKKNQPRRVREALLESRREQEEEYRRLLYVGLTRARDHLIIAGIAGRLSKPDGRWYTLVSAALDADALAEKDDAGNVVRWLWRANPLDRREPMNSAVSAEKQRMVKPLVLPAFLRAGILQTPIIEEQLSPSHLAEMKESSASFLFEAKSAEEMESAKRGRLIHRLFEMLPGVPRGERRPLARAYLAQAAPDNGQHKDEEIIDHVLKVLDHPDFAEFFGSESRGEVGIVGRLMRHNGNPLLVTGRIDRLLRKGKEVFIIDLKTGRPPRTGVPYFYVDQLALYRGVLRQLYDGSHISAGLLWTQIPKIDFLRPADLDERLQDLLKES